MVCGLAFGRPPARDLPVRRRVCTRAGIDSGRSNVVGTSRRKPRRSWQVQWDVAALDVWWGYMGVCCTHHAWRVPGGWVWLLGYAAVVRRLCGNHLSKNIQPACLLDRRWRVRPWLCTGDYYGSIITVQWKAFDLCFSPTRSCIEHTITRALMYLALQTRVCAHPLDSARAAAAPPVGSRVHADWMLLHLVAVRMPIAVPPFPK